MMSTATSLRLLARIASRSPLSTQLAKSPEFHQNIQALAILARSIHVSSTRFVDKPKYDAFSKRKSEWRIPTLTDQQFGERSFMTQVLTGWAILSLICYVLAMQFYHRGY